MIIIKIQSRTESSVTIVAYMGIFLGLFSLLPAIWVWQPFGIQTLGWLVLIGLSGTIAQMAISQSLKETDPTATMPFDFLKLIWTAMIGAWLFAEIPDIFTWIGATVIFLSGFFIALRERRASSSVSQWPDQGARWQKTGSPQAALPDALFTMMLALPKAWCSSRRWNCFLSLGSDFVKPLKYRSRSSDYSGKEMDVSPEDKVVNRHILTENKLWLCSSV